MVDLVKIRKKAKATGDRLREATGDRRQATEEAAPAPQPAAIVAEAEPLMPHASSLMPEPQSSVLSPQSSKLEKFKDEAGRLRESAEETTSETTTTGTEILTFVIAAENYGIDIERIVEIVTPRPITRVPNADGAIVGIISLRGTIVTLLDVRSRLRHPRAEETPDTRIIVVELQGEPIGFEVDRVLRVIKLAAGEVEPHPVVHASELDDSIRGVFRHAGALTILLDFDKLLGS
jgi:purine-binding chemotaxis protein CheW